jgi:hypothetical protein
MKLHGVKHSHPHGRAYASARTRACPHGCANASERTRACPRGRTTSTPLMPSDLERLHKGSSNISFSLPSLLWPKEATVCLVHFVVWAAIGGSFFGHTCRYCADQVFLYSTF